MRLAACFAPGAQGTFRQFARPVAARTTAAVPRRTHFKFAAALVDYPRTSSLEPQPTGTVTGAAAHSSQSDLQVRHSSDDQQSSTQKQTSQPTSQRDLKRRSNQAAGAQSKRRQRNLGKADIQQFFTSDFNPNAAYVAITPEDSISDLAVFIKRVLVQRPQAELCLFSFTADALYAATRAISQAHIALTIDRKIGLHVQPKGAGINKPVKLWVCRDAHKLNWQVEEDFYRVSRSTTQGKLAGAVAERIQQVEKFTVAATGGAASNANSVAKVWAALAHAREILSKLESSFDFKVTPQIEEVMLPAPNTKPDLAVLRFLYMIERCDHKVRPKKPDAQSANNSVEPQQQGQQQHAALTPQQAEELARKVEQMQAQLKLLLEAEAARKQAEAA